MHINLSREVVCGNSFLMLAYLTGGCFFGGLLFYVTDTPSWLLRPVNVFTNSKLYPGCFPSFLFPDFFVPNLSHFTASVTVFFVPSLSHFTASATVLRRRFLHPRIFYLALLFQYFCAFVA